MRQLTIEKRLSDLEGRMSELSRMVHQSARAKDWRRSIGAFTDSPEMQAVLAAALDIRAADRARAHRRPGKKPRRKLGRA